MCKQVMYQTLDFRKILNLNGLCPNAKTSKPSKSVHNRTMLFIRGQSRAVSSGSGYPLGPREIYRPHPSFQAKNRLQS